ncbi:MAG: patatin-like phospholipase family protein [Campylobacterales bacterium]|nr:patatin-like phospholipase family protein [Campylobacterales bacterium]
MKRLTCSVLALAFALGGCGEKNRYDDLRIVSRDQVVPIKRTQQPRIAIAFGGGGVRGFVHLGVIKALEEAGIRAQIVTGTSAGSIAAALYATGKSYREIEASVRALSESELRDLVLSTHGVINGQGLRRWLDQVSGGVDIAAMPVPLGITLTDLERDEPLLAIGGSVGAAVQTSSSVPGVFVPVEIAGKRYVDGGVLSIVPIRFARAMGGDIVIGVDIYCDDIKARHDNMAMTMLSTFRLQSCVIAKEELGEADVLIRSNYDPGSVARFGDLDAAIDAGYRATQAVMPEILARIGAR